MLKFAMVLADTSDVVPVVTVFCCGEVMWPQSMVLLMVGSNPFGFTLEALPVAKLLERLFALRMERKLWAEAAPKPVAPPVVAVEIPAGELPDCALNKSACANGKRYRSTSMSMLFSSASAIASCRDR